MLSCTEQEARSLIGRVLKGRYQKPHRTFPRTEQSLHRSFATQFPRNHDERTFHPEPQHSDPTWTRRRVRNGLVVFTSGVQGVLGTVWTDRLSSCRAVRRGVHSQNARGGVHRGTAVRKEPRRTRQASPPRGICTKRTFSSLDSIRTTFTGRTPVLLERVASPSPMP